MKKIGNYKNGNYSVEIFDNGTKIRETNEDVFIASFPENIDVKITNYCDMNCPMCHEGSTTEGKHGDILNAKFIDSLNPYTELALGGGNPLSHPYIVEFLIKCKKRRIITNMTVNQVHFMKNIELIDKLIKSRLIHGLGVSLTNAYDKEFVDTIKRYHNVVIHIINGMITRDELKQLYNNNFKILILGYKQFRRGIDNYDKNSLTIENHKNDLYNDLAELTNYFKVISFDNLAIEQLKVKRIMSEEYWNSFYMGDDGKHTMYIDLVKNKFAKNSISKDRFDLLDDIKDIFKIVLTL